MQKSKIFFQIFIWTFLVNIREAKPTSQNSERMHRRAITGPIPDLYGPIADIPPTFSSAIEVRICPPEWQGPPNSEQWLFAVRSVRTNLSEHSKRVQRSEQRTPKIFTGLSNYSPCSGVLKIFGVFCSNCSIDLSVRAVHDVEDFGKYWCSRRKVRPLQFGHPNSEQVRWE